MRPRGRADPGATGGRGQRGRDERDVFGRRLPTAVPTYEIALDEVGWERFVRLDANGHCYLPLGTLGHVTKGAAADCLDGPWTCIEELSVLHRIPMAREGRILQVSLRPDSEGHVVYEWHSRSPLEEAAGAPWLLHGRGVLRRRAVGRALGPARIVQLDPSLYPDEVEYETVSLSSALVHAVATAHRGEGGVLVALDQQRVGSRLPWIEVLDAAVAALSWDAGTEGRVTGFARRLKEGVCDAPEEVRYVRGTALDCQQTPGMLTGSIEFFAEDGTPLGGVRELQVVTSEAIPPPPAPWRPPDELLFRLEWQPARPAPRGPALPGESVLLLPDRGGLAPGLARELQLAGAHCFTASPDEARPDRAVLKGLLDRWLHEADRDAALPSQVVLLTGTEAPDPQQATPEAVEAFRARTELTVIALLQEMTDRDDFARTKLAFVTRGAVPAGGPDDTTGSGPDAASPGVVSPGVVSPLGAMLWGLGRVLALEDPAHWGGAVDLDPGDDDVAALSHALLDLGAEDQQALRGSGGASTRYTARLVRHRLAPGDLHHRQMIDPNGSYLITGGFGGIGKTVARWLAQAGAGKLTLLGRTPLPAREEWDLPFHSPDIRERIATVRSLELAGVVVQVVVADVGDAQQMAQVMDEVTVDDYPLRGIVHAASATVPEPLRDIAVEEPRGYDASWRPKVIGGLLLHQLTEWLDLDFFLCTSSIAAVWGAKGLAGSGAAGAFLDSFAAYRRATGNAGTTIAWGPWESVPHQPGGGELASLTARGLRQLAAPQCLKLLGTLLAGGAARTVVCAADWPVYKPVLEHRAERPVLRTLTVPDEPAATGPTPLLDELRVLARPERTERLTGYVGRMLAEVSDTEQAELRSESDVQAIGMDSLMMMEIIRRLKQDLRLSVRPSQFADAGTVADWAELLAGQLDADHTGHTDGAGQPDQHAPGIDLS